MGDKNPNKTKKKKKEPEKIEKTVEQPAIAAKKSR
jgi:hypothetical protein